MEVRRELSKTAHIITSSLMGEFPAPCDGVPALIEFSYVSGEGIQTSPQPQGLRWADESNVLSLVVYITGSIDGDPGVRGLLVDPFRRFVVFPKTVTGDEISRFISAKVINSQDVRCRKGSKI